MAKFCSRSFSDQEANYYISTRKSLSSSSRLHLNRFDNENLERKMSDEAMASRRRPQHAFGRSVLTFTISRPCNLKCSSESPSTQHHCVVESELKKCISTLHLYRDLLYCSSTHILVFWWSQNKALVLTRWWGRFRIFSKTKANSFQNGERAKSPRIQKISLVQDSQFLFS